MFWSDDFRTFGFIERRSPRVRFLLIFLMMSGMMAVLLRVTGSETNPHIAFVSLCTGLGLAGTVAIRDRRRAQGKD